jgi:Holliday junction resolvase RusA-like endonuclease
MVKKQLIYQSPSLIRGTPRGYGKKETEDSWKKPVIKALEDVMPLSENKYHITLEFNINPDSKRYWGKNKPDGPDIDNLVKTTIDAVFMNSGIDDKAVYSIKATKRIVKRDGNMGVKIKIESEKRC